MSFDFKIKITSLVVRFLVVLFFTAWAIHYFTHDKIIEGLLVLALAQLWEIELNTRKKP